jgi:shikimate dehydrogenase
VRLCPARRGVVSRRTRLGVVGWPVAHSRSPAIQNAALRAVGLGEWRYQRLPIPPELFAEMVVALPGAGFRGVNVTIPYKEAALACASDPTDQARAIGAANTLMFGADGRIVAENTDAPGLIAALPFAPAQRTALVLGAGGSARAAAWALLDAGAPGVPRSLAGGGQIPDRGRHSRLAYGPRIPR